MEKRFAETAAGIPARCGRGRYGQWFICSPAVIDHLEASDWSTYALDYASSERDFTPDGKWIVFKPRCTMRGKTFLQWKVWRKRGRQFGVMVERGLGGSDVDVWRNSSGSSSRLLACARHSNWIVASVPLRGGEPVFDGDGAIHSRRALAGRLTS
jgi:hypothetical protein